MIHVQQRLWTKEGGWTEPETKLPEEAQLIFVFGDRDLVADPKTFEQVREFYPEAYILSASTAGNILGNEVTENSVTLSALYFEKTRISFVETTVINAFDSSNVGKKLSEFLPIENLVHSFVVSDGLSINGSALVESINANLPNTVTVTGGLAGDGSDFKTTVVGGNAVPQPNRVTLIGFYSTSLKVGYATGSGWVAGNEIYSITKSVGNTLYELNSEPALDVYKRLLGEKAAELPSSGLLFPLQLELTGGDKVVRTILSVDEATKSITFAGDMPQGIVVRVMHATEEELIENAKLAGEKAAEGISPVQFALLVSCVGRRLVLKDRTSEEVKAVQSVLGEKAFLHGFYSYGELCPHKESGKRCLLHNQTMTVTTFSEI